VKPPDLPDIVTMNTGHSTHSTENIPTGIRHVLRGWDPAGGIARHDVMFKDLRVYSLPTNIEGFGAGMFATSSIFVIQAAGMCIVHLGNIRHVIDDERIQRMGRVDIALVPVDRFVTNTHDETLYNLEQMKPKLIIPMHINHLGPAQDFAERAAAIYKSRLHDSNTIVVSRASLPQFAEILILRLSATAGGPGGDGI
jgi:L-ascorbate metabolism protein UlaG (beta-lactamase superfamily)